MLKDITIGQYFPGHGLVHNLDPRMKIILVMIYVAMIFFIRTIPGLCIPVLYACLGFFVAKIPLKVIWKSLKPMVPIILFTSVLNMFFVTGEVLFSFWIFSVSKEGILFAVLLSIRILCLIVGTSLLTYTTSPMALTDAIERLLNPLKKCKVPVHELSMMMTIALRFIPTLIEETDKIMCAQKSRGADLETGTLMERVKAMIPILIPLFVSSFRRAEDLALAMECRCYTGGEGRTRMKQLRYHGRDWVMLGVSFAMVFAILLSNQYFTAVL